MAVIPDGFHSTKISDFIKRSKPYLKVRKRGAIFSFKNLENLCSPEGRGRGEL